MSSHRFRHADRGAMTLFMMLVVFPIILFGLFLAIDLRRYHEASAAVQADLDNAVMSAAHSLPFQQDAASVARRYLALYNRALYGVGGEGVGGGKVSLSTQGDSISLRYDGDIALTFGQILSMLSAGSESTPVGVSAFAEARLTPFDVFIAMDASAAYLAPLNAVGSTPWGSELEWPSASFFRNEFSFMGSGETIDARIATQQCFNRPLIAMKTAVINAYTYFSSFERDQVGVGVYPGYGTTLDVVRPVRARSDAAAVVGGAEAVLPSYIGHNRADVYCLAAAEREDTFLSYRFPAPNSYLTAWTPSSTVPVNRVLAPEWEIDSAFVPVASVSEVLWGSVARGGTPADFGQLLNEATARVLGAPVPDARAGLRAVSLKQLFIFAGDVPWVNGVRWSPGALTEETAMKNAIGALRDEVVTTLAPYNMQLKVTYVLFEHEGNGPAGAISSVVPQLSTLFSDAAARDGVPSKAFSIEVQYVQDSDVFTKNLMPLLTLGQRSVVLSR